MTDFADKTVVITGASRGIGAAAGRAFAEAGATVFLAARSTAEIEKLAAEISAAGGRAVAQACDVSRYEDVHALISAAVSDTGRLDILVNNAGLIEPIARLAESDPAEWARVVDVNYKGVYFGLRAAIPVMERQGEGVIVNISSGAAVSALEGWSHYCSSKAAALSLTRCAHKEVADRGVRVVGLSPGTVATNMQVAIKASGVNPVSQLDPSVHIPAEWVARAILWLSTDAAREFDGEDFSLKTEEGRRLVGLA